MAMEEILPGRARIPSGPSVDRGPMIDPFGRVLLIQDRAGAVEVAQSQERDPLVDGSARESEHVAMLPRAAVDHRLLIGRGALERLLVVASPDQRVDGVPEGRVERLVPAQDGDQRAPKPVPVEGPDPIQEMNDPPFRGQEYEPGFDELRLAEADR